MPAPERVTDMVPCGSCDYVGLSPGVAFKGRYPVPASPIAAPRPPWTFANQAIPPLKSPGVAQAANLVGRRKTRSRGGAVADCDGVRAV